MTMFRGPWGNIPNMAKKSPTKKTPAKKPAAKAAKPKPAEAAAEPGSVVEERWEAPVKVARDADQHTRDTKRQQAIVMVVLSQAGVTFEE